MPQLVQAAMMAAFGTGEGEGMSSYADIKINGQLLIDWGNTYNEWYFTKDDRVSSHEVELNTEAVNRFIGYRASAAQIRRRLQLAGYDIKSVEQDFNITRSLWIKDMMECLSSYHEESYSSHKLYSSVMYELSWLIKEQLEVVKSTRFEDWLIAFREYFNPKYDYVKNDISKLVAKIDGEPLLSLMHSDLFGVSERNVGICGSLFPCTSLENYAVLLLDMCSDSDLCVLDITDLVDGGWVEPFIEVGEVREGKTHFFKIFENSLVELKDIQLDESTPVLQRMIFSSVITAMEAYLSDTLKKNVLNRDAIKKRFVKNSEHLKNSGKIFISDIYEELDKLDKKIIDDIDSTSFHSVKVVTGLYEKVLLCSFPKDKVAQLTKSVEIRHDIVHRNGKTTEGSIITISKEDVENLMILVSDVVSHIDKQILDGLLDTGAEQH